MKINNSGEKQSENDILYYYYYHDRIYIGSARKFERYSRGRMKSKLLAAAATIAATVSYNVVWCVSTALVRIDYIHCHYYRPNTCAYMRTPPSV